MNPSERDTAIEVVFRLLDRFWWSDKEAPERRPLSRAMPDRNVPPTSPLAISRWNRLSPECRARELQSWLDAQRDHLQNVILTTPQRFRRAWDLSPNSLFDAPITEDAVHTMAKTIKSTAESLADHDARLPAIPSRARIDGLDETRNRFVTPPFPETAWTALPSAIDLTFRAFDLLNLELCAGRPSSTRLPFFFVAYDALLPGYARLLRSHLGPEQLAALDHLLHAGWFQIGEEDSVGARTDVRPNADAVRLIRRVFPADATAARLRAWWGRSGARTRLSNLEVLAGLGVVISAPLGVVDRRREPGWVAQSFVPSAIGADSPAQCEWVGWLVHGVRHSWAVAHATALPGDVERFLDDAVLLLPPKPRGARGPAPMNDRQVLRAIVQKYGRDLPWKQVPAFQAVRRRLETLDEETGARLAELAVERRILHPGAAGKLQRDVRRRAVRE